MSSDTEERLQAAAQLPALAGSNSLNPVTSKTMNHRVPMGGGGYMHSYSKAAAGRVSGPSASTKAGRQPVPSARSSAYKYKAAPSSNASSVSNAAVGKTGSKYVSPYSQAYLGILRE